MNIIARRALSLLPVVALLAGCGGEAPPPAAAPAAIARAPMEQPVLARSLFAKNGTGAISESDLQTVLSSPIDLQFPARIGVVPVGEPFDAHRPVSMGMRAIASRDFAKALVGHPYFSHVSDISTDLPNTGGIEGLRAIAARYRLRYLVLYSERFEDATHLNGWAWLYPTVVGMFVSPGVTVESVGLAQADLLDVRTGTILFSVVQPMNVSAKELMIGAKRSHEELQTKASAEAAKALAKRVAIQTNALIAFADDAAAHPVARARILPPPVMVDAVPSDATAKR